MWLNSPEKKSEYNISKKESKRKGQGDGIDQEGHHIVQGLNQFHQRQGKEEDLLQWQGFLK